MLGAGTVINPIIKIVTTVVILGAVYLFIVKPTLDTTNNAFDSITDPFDNLGGLSDNLQSQINDAIDSSGDSSRLQQCIENAINGTDVNQNQIERCIDRFG